MLTLGGIGGGMGAWVSCREVAELNLHVSANCRSLKWNGVCMCSSLPDQHGTCTPTLSAQHTHRRIRQAQALCQQEKPRLGGVLVRRPHLSPVEGRLFDYTIEHEPQGLHTSIKQLWFMCIVCAACACMKFCKSMYETLKLSYLLGARDPVFLLQVECA